MKKMIVSMATLVLVVGQATVASATTNDAPVLTKVSANACAAPTKSTKPAKAARVQNRCAVSGVGAAPLVLAGAVVAGVVAVAVVTTDNNSAASP